MLIDQVEFALLRAGAQLITALNKAAVGLLSSVLPDSYQRVVVFSLVKVEEKWRRKVLATFHAAVDMSLVIVDFVVVKG